MDKFVIEGGSKLSGNIKISGAKNAALPLLCATLLSDKECVLENIPNLADIDTTFKILNFIGVQTEWDKKNQKASINGAKANRLEAPYDLVRTMRASVLVLGPMLARFGEAKVSLPGGCAIGARPVNLHLTALEQMGATITIDGGYIHAKAKKLKGTTIRFPIISVGATENTLMAAALADGETIIENAALEPEIVDLANLLKAMGVPITGEGTNTIRVKGVGSIQKCNHKTIPDRIEAGTYLSAVAIAGGKIHLDHVKASLLPTVIDKYIEAGLTIVEENGGLTASFDPAKGALKACDIQTKEFPGFATDMQAQFMAAMCFTKGSSTISENIFENRFMHVPELIRLGADIAIQGNTAVVKGKGPLSLSGATVMATDLRASASLVLAGLGAKGETQVRRIYHLDRGYENMEKKLSSLGAKVSRTEE